MRPKYKPTQNKEKEKVIKEREDSQAPQGFGGTNLSEDIAAFNVLSCEKVFKGQSDSWIVLGRDRPGAKVTGGVGSGASQLKKEISILILDWQKVPKK